MMNRRWFAPTLNLEQGRPRVRTARLHPRDRPRDRRRHRGVQQLRVRRHQYFLDIEALRMTGTRAREDALVWRGADAAGARHAAARGSRDRGAVCPPSQYLVNLCEQREAFVLAFAAAVLAGRTQLMPAARGETALAELRAEYPGLLRPSATTTCSGGARALRRPSAGPALPDRRRPAGHDRLHLGQHRQVAAARQALARAREQRAAQFHRHSRRAGPRRPTRRSRSIGTVPAHHMYGIELTVLLPLFANMSVHADRPLFPADVAAVLAQPARPRVLVSTPLHLRALAESGLDVSRDRSHRQRHGAARSGAGAGSSRHGCARRCSRCSAPPRPACSRTRRTAQQDVWKIYDGISLETGTRFHAGFRGLVRAPTTADGRARACVATMASWRWAATRIWSKSRASAPRWRTSRAGCARCLASRTPWHFSRMPPPRASPIGSPPW